MSYPSLASSKRKLLASVVLFFICALGANAAVIEKIAVIADAQNAGFIQEALADRVYHLIRTHAGQELSDKILADDIKVLMNSGAFDDVKVERVDLGNNKVGLNFIVKPKPIVVDYTIKGNEKYKSKKLEKLIVLEKGKPLDERKLAASRKAILEKYRNAGYYGTEVTTSQDKAEGTESIKITFVINEKPRCKLKGVGFTGNTAFTVSELKDIVVTKRQLWRYIFRFGNYYNEYQHDLDKEALRKAYHAKGYLDFEVIEIQEQKLEDGKWVFLNFKLQEGKPYTISAINMTGNTRFTKEQLLEKTKLAVGGIYNADQETKDVDLMKAYYETLGYLDLRFYPRHEKDSEKHEVAIEYRVYEGNVCRIRDIVITGNEHTSDKVIRRELGIHSDDLGDNSLIRLSKNRLMNLGYFEKVDIMPAITDTPDLRNLRIELEEKPTGQISLGAGFSTDDSAMGFVEFNETNFDLSKIFLGEWPPKGGGQKFRARIQVGSEVSNASISLTEPWFLDRRLEFQNEIFYNNRFENEYDQRNIGLSSMLSWPIKFKIPGTEHTEYWKMGVGVRLEYISITDVDNTRDDLDNIDADWLERWYQNSGVVRDRIIYDDEDSFVVNRLIWRVTRDTRNSFRFPSRGSIVSLQAEYVTTALGSYENYGKIELAAAKYVPVFSDVVMKTGANFGSGTGEKAAIFDRYFAGGIGTMRGFKRRDVAPVDAFDDPLGGNTILTGTVEFLKPVKDFMYFCTFVDVGNVWWDAFEVDPSDLNVSAGIGVQFKALPINLYYGYPIRTGYDHLDGKSGRFHFNIGYTF